MPCYHPLTAYRGRPGEAISFNEGPDSGAQLELPCGRCIGCRVKRNQEWATRCMHEAHMHQDNAFITLTYEGEEIDPSLNYNDFRKFIRSLRREGRKFRYFVAGEYGEINDRPHWHALLFGTNFENQKQIAKNLTRSPDLEKHWKHGFSSIGEVNWTTASYVAGYVLKKVTGEKALKHYERVNLETGEVIQLTPEFARMSLKPAIGKTFYEKYWHEIHGARDAVVKPGGKTTRPPRYYDKLLEKMNMNRAIEIETERLIQGELRQKDNTRERLETREKVKYAELKQKQRKL